MVRSVKEIAAGSGVGVGVLNQTSPDEEEEEGSEETEDDDKAPAPSSEQESPKTEAKLSYLTQRRRRQLSLSEKRNKKIMKIKKTKLQEMVTGLVKKKLQELADHESIPGADGKLGKFAEKCDKFLNSGIDDINDLVKEAEDMMRENLLNHPTVGERNRALMARVGILKSLKAKMLEMLEATHRHL